MDSRFDDPFFHQLVFFCVFGAEDDTVGVALKMDALSSAWLYDPFSDTRERNRRIDVGRPPGDSGGDMDSSAVGEE